MRLFILVIFFFQTAIPVLANNIQITSTTLVNQNVASGYVDVQFNISWDNSWRVSSAPNNWDAAWIFIKYKLQNGEWKHAILSNIVSDYTIPANGQITTTSDGAGVFLFRSSDGTGTFTASNCKIRWNYSANGIAYNSIVDYNIYGIEMVYVPQASFKLGAYNSGTSYFFDGGNSANPYSVNSENAISWGCSGTGALCFTCCGSNGGDRSGSIPAEFPKGYGSFYCMKYEITQEQYADFLNTLSYDQQTTRTATSPSSASGTGALSGGNNSRNGIDIVTAGAQNSAPAVYACNLDGDLIYNEANDGQWVACNFLSFMDLSAYLDWACLRPMTELEYEKACRGTNNAVSGEYAWGTASKSATAITITNIGSSTEEILTGYSTNSTIGNCCNHTTSWPMRVGIFASNTLNTGRVSSGATFYGIMEMTGNVAERAVTAGNATGRSFTGLNGDGALSLSGNANVLNWPGLSNSEVTSSLGSGFRGGGWGDGYGKVSDRFLGAYVDDSRCDGCGGRGVRSSN